MDASEKYIMMCFLADRDLRPLYKFERGDWIFSSMDSPPFTPKVLSDYGLIVPNNSRVVTFAFPDTHMVAYAIAEGETIPMDVTINKIDFYRVPEYMWVRLHRQDQLQDMIQLNDLSGRLIKFSKDTVYPDSVRRVVLLEKFKKFFECHRGMFSSFEQTWLAFVMKVKFKKTWDGTEWGVIK